MIYNLCLTLIAKYKKTKAEEKLEELADKIDIYFAANRLTEAEYQTLQERMA